MFDPFIAAVQDISSTCKRVRERMKQEVETEKPVRTQEFPPCKSCKEVMPRTYNNCIEGRHKTSLVDPSYTYSTLA